MYLYILLSLSRAYSSIIISDICTICIRRTNSKCVCISNRYRTIPLQLTTKKFTNSLDEEQLCRMLCALSAVLFVAVVVAFVCLCVQVCTNELLVCASAHAILCITHESEVKLASGYVWMCVRVRCLAVVLCVLNSSLKTPSDSTQYAYVFGYVSD